MQTDRLFPPGHSLRIRFVRNPDKLFLMTDAAATEYKVVIEKLELHIRVIDLMPKVTQTLLDKFRNTPILYPVNRTVIKTFALPVNANSLLIPNIYQGRLPKSIIVGLVDTDAFQV